LVHVQVASQCSPEDAFEGAHSVPWDDASYESDVPDREILLAINVAVLARRLLLLLLLLYILQKGCLVVVIKGLSNFFSMAMSLSPASASHVGQYDFVTRDCALTRSKKPPASLKTQRHSIN
jgi:hypothetical protein